MELKDAGRNRIAVEDNGLGMGGEDAALCFERHATSKLRSADDLLALATMGFRGEALASIAAIRRLATLPKPNRTWGVLGRAKDVLFHTPLALLPFWARFRQVTGLEFEQSGLGPYVPKRASKFGRFHPLEGTGSQA